jgi:hypothetical protein
MKMIWEIKAYNGTTDSFSGITLTEAVEEFIKKHKLCEADIKSAINQH